MNIYKIDYSNGYEEIYNQITLIDKEEIKVVLKDKKESIVKKEKQGTHEENSELNKKNELSKNSSLPQTNYPIYRPIINIMIGGGYSIISGNSVFSMPSDDLQGFGLNHGFTFDLVTEVSLPVKNLFINA